MQKVAMVGERIPIRSKIESALYIYQAHKDKLFSNTKAAITQHQVLRGYLDKYVGVPVEKSRVLDLGCGQRATQTALFQADGADVIGIDIEIPSYKISLPIFLRIIRLNGVERALKSMARHILFDKGFFSELSREYRESITFNDIDTRIMDATCMTFDAASFDFVFSSAVFEHINDVAAAVKEVNRVLSPVGIAVISIHLFPSLSGGYSLEWVFPDQTPSTRVPPWDHLQSNKYPANVYLNKLSINQYRHIFQSYTNVIEEHTVLEGEQQLTKEIEVELKGKGYTREDLLTRSITFLVRKKV